jgi:hypothetical protein
MRSLCVFCTLILTVTVCRSGTGRVRSQEKTTRNTNPPPSPAYLGFDVNEYPGDTALPALRRIFSFAGYWLNPPPGAATNTWTGKRAALLEAGLGFLVLFNGRTSRQLGSSTDASALGTSDAEIAVSRAEQESFPLGTVIFLDQEEGGRLTLEQRAYLFAWINRVRAKGFGAGVYCSGIPAKEGRGRFVITALDVRNQAGRREISFFVYNDACPPSPGCAFPKKPPAPSVSGVPFASVWQFAQSPRRHEFTGLCSSTYSSDGSCHALAGAGLDSFFLDLDSADSSDPSNGRRGLLP